jgi:hypothetical protein
MTDPVGQNWAKLLPEIYEMPAKRQAPFWAKPRPKASKPIIHGRLIVAEQPDYESEGRRFESCRARHTETSTATLVAVFFCFSRKGKSEGLLGKIGQINCLARAIYCADV